MAHDALAEAITSTLNLPPGQYYLPDTETFIASLTKITGTVQTVMKAAGHIIAQHKYDLGFNIYMGYIIRSCSQITDHTCTYNTPAMFVHLCEHSRSFHSWWAILTSDN